MKNKVELLTYKAEGKKRLSRNIRGNIKEREKVQQINI